MSVDDIQVVLAMALYFIVVLSVGFFYLKKSNASSENYFLGGRGLGPWLTALSAEASDMSGWLLMGLPGIAYFTGASDAMWTAIGLAIGTYLNWKFVAKRLRKYSEVAGNAITLPDFFSNRFRDDKRILMSVAAIIILLFFCIYCGSCFVTCGKLFATLFGLDYTTMMILGALVVFVYTFVGGYLSVCTTDLIQGAIMICALVIVFVGSVAMAAWRIPSHSFRAFPDSCREPSRRLPFLTNQAVRWSKTACRCLATRFFTALAPSPSSAALHGVLATSVCPRCSFAL